MKQRIFEYFEFVFFGIILIPIAIIYFILKLPSEILNWISWELHYFDSINKTNKKTPNKWGL
jgi:hypothetical protein